MSDLEKANRRLRRANGAMGCLASLQLAVFWVGGLALCGFGGWIALQIAQTFRH